MNLRNSWTSHWLMIPTIIVTVDCIDWTKSLLRISSLPSLVWWHPGRYSSLPVSFMNKDHLIPWCTQPTYVFQSRKSYHSAYHPKRLEFLGPSRCCAEKTTVLTTLFCCVAHSLVHRTAVICIGNDSHNYGKSPCLMEKTTISSHFP